MSEKLYQIQPLLDQNQILLNSIDQNRKEGTLEAQERNAVLLTALGQSLGETMQGYKTMADGQGGEKKLKKRDKKG